MGGTETETGGVVLAEVMLQHGDLGVVFRQDDGAGEGGAVFAGEPMDDFDRVGDFGVGRDDDNDGVAQLGLVEGGEFFAAKAGAGRGEDGFEAIAVLGEGFGKGEDLDGGIGDVLADEGIVHKDEPGSGFFQGAGGGRRWSGCAVGAAGGRGESVEREELQVRKAPGFVAAARHGEVGKGFPCAALGLDEPRGQAGMIPRRGIKKYRSHKRGWG